MTNEDFTTYTEVDEHGDIIVTSSKVQWVDMNNDSTSYVYKDFGVDHFGDFSHDTEFCANASSPFGTSCFYAVANRIDEHYTFTSNNYPSIVVKFSKPGANMGFYLADTKLGNTDSGTVTATTLYYCTVARTGTTATVNIYTDSNRTVLHDTLTITCANDEYRYLYACMGRDENQADYPTSGYSQNFDLGAIPPIEEALFDTVSISDSIVFKHKIFPSDTIDINDVIAFKHSIYLTDNIDIDDSIIIKYLISIADTQSFSDTVALKRLLYLYDTLDISDSMIPTLKEGVYILDNLSILDEIAIVIRDTCGTVFQLHGDTYAVFLPIPDYAGESGSINNELVLFDFWLDDISVDTIGINSEPITLGGTIFACSDNEETEMTLIAAKFLNIHEMMDNHEEIRISGLSNCVDAVYIIKDFKYKTIRSSPYAYTWNLTLEYVRAL